MGLSAFIFSFIGFGFGLTAVPLLALIIPIQDAVSLQLPFAAVLVCYNAWRYRRLVSWRKMAPLLIAAAVALPVGLWSLTYFPERFMIRALAVFIVLAVISGRWTPKQQPNRDKAPPAWLGVVLGSISGWFTGAYTTGGPPAVIYALMSCSDPKEVKGFIAVYFAMLVGFAAALFVWTGVISIHTVQAAVPLVPAVLIGAVLGGLAFRRFSPEVWRWGADILLLLSAGTLWFR